MKSTGFGLHSLVDLAFDRFVGHKSAIHRFTCHRRGTRQFASASAFTYSLDLVSVTQPSFDLQSLVSMTVASDNRLQLQGTGRYNTETRSNTAAAAAAAAAAAMDNSTLKFSDTQIGDKAYEKAVLQQHPNVPLSPRTFQPSYVHSSSASSST